MLFRARYCPQNQFLIGTKSPTGDVFVYDYSKHPSRPAEGDNECKPELRCKGHTADGFGLDWSPLLPGKLLSGSDDHQICLWDTHGKTAAGGTLDPVSTFNFHEGMLRNDLAVTQEL